MPSLRLGCKESRSQNRGLPPILTPDHFLALEVASVWGLQGFLAIHFQRLAHGCSVNVDPFPLARLQLHPASDPQKDFEEAMANGLLWPTCAGEGLRKILDPRNYGTQPRPVVPLFRFAGLSPFRSTTKCRSLEIQSSGFSGGDASKLNPGKNETVRYSPNGCFSKHLERRFFFFKSHQAHTAPGGSHQAKHLPQSKKRAQTLSG